LLFIINLLFIRKRSNDSRDFVNEVRLLLLVLIKLVGISTFLIESVGEILFSLISIQFSVT